MPDDDVYYGKEKIRIREMEAMRMGMKTALFSVVNAGLLDKTTFAQKYEESKGQRHVCIPSTGKYSAKGTERRDQIGPNLKRRREKSRMALRFELRSFERTVASLVEMGS